MRDLGSKSLQVLRESKSAKHDISSYAMNVYICREIDKM